MQLLCCSIENNETELWLFVYVFAFLSCFVKKKLLLSFFLKEMKFISKQNQANLLVFKSVCGKLMYNFYMQKMTNDICHLFFSKNIFSNCSKWMLNGNVFLLTKKLTINHSMHNGYVYVYQKRVYHWTEIHMQVYTLVMSSFHFFDYSHPLCPMEEKGRENIAINCAIDLNFIGARVR